MVTTWDAHLIPIVNLPGVKRVLLRTGAATNRCGFRQSDALDEV